MPYQNRKQRRGRYNIRRRAHRYRGSRRSFRRKRMGYRATLGISGTAHTRQTGGNPSRMSTLRLYQPSMVPDTIFLKLKYNDVLDRIPGTGVERLLFNGNGLIDPNQMSAGGLSPLGFFEWMIFYARYRVFGSSINMKVYNANGSEGMLWSIYPTYRVPAVLLAYVDTVSQPYAQSGLVGVEVSNNIANFTSYMETKKLHGDVITSVNWAGTVTTNPSRLWSWVFQVRSQNTTPDVVYSAITEIVYYVKLFDKTVLVQKSVALLAAGIEKAQRLGILCTAAEINALPKTPDPPVTPPPPKKAILPPIPPPKALGPNGTEIISDAEDGDGDISMKAVRQLVGMSKSELEKFLDA